MLDGMSRVVRAAVSLAVCVIPAGAAEIDKPTVAWIETALNRWETACRRYLNLPSHPLPWVILFDERAAWHVNPEKAWLPPHRQLKSSVKFVGRKYPLIQVEHRDGRLWVPDRDPLPVKSGGAAMPYDNDRNVFFELALPSLWRRESGVPPSRDLDETVLGFALHELTHTRQLAGVVGRIEAMRSRSVLPESVNDNLIENTFGKNAEYKKMFDDEFGHLSRALLADDPKLIREAISEALAASQRRRERFFVGDYQGWSGLDDIFLVMEGMGMWVHYRMARDHAPKGEDWRRTATVLGSRGDTWSQLEGLALILLIDRFVPGWQARFLAPGFPSPFAVLREALNAPQIRINQAAPSASPRSP